MRRFAWTLIGVAAASALGACHLVLGIDDVSSANGPDGGHKAQGVSVDSDAAPQDASGRGTTGPEEDAGGGQFANAADRDAAAGGRRSAAADPAGAAGNGGAGSPAAGSGSGRMPMAGSGGTGAGAGAGAAAAGSGGSNAGSSASAGSGGATEPGEDDAGLPVSLPR